MVQKLCVYILKNTIEQIDTNERFEDVEIDEVWSYVNKKKRKVWTFIAYDRASKKVLGIQIGKRNKNTFKKLYKRLKKLNIGTMHTDAFKAYHAVVPCLQGTIL